MPRALAAGLLLWAWTASAAPPAFDKAFDRMYNFEFPAAHSVLDGYIGQHPSEPLPYAFKAAAHLFGELDRMGILEGQFFADDKRIAEKKKMAPDPRIRQQFQNAVDNAQAKANAVLAADPNNAEALFAMAVTQGVMTDYMALVEKRQIASLTPAKQSNVYAQRLLKAHPTYYDAYLTTGFTEYVVGSLPFFIRWFIHFDNVTGSKDRGIDLVSRVAKDGHYLKPFAKILLSIAFLRDKKYTQSRDLLAELSRDYPSNPLFRKELAKMDTRIGAAAN